MIREPNNPTLLTHEILIYYAVNLISKANVV